ncbi:MULTISPECIES: hypothetical protein [unclassified Yoonia]|uniref:hypothetical protein n=1 Tax=unclassified Yoonia TaxID=2629118 RepID=UPI002AFF1111|nr:MULTISPECIES: hypothetical protein [unclassified Yoonia]
MFKVTFCVTVIMGSVLLASAAEASVQTPRIIAGASHSDLHLADLSTLTDRDRRRLDFYASKIVEEIDAISALEDTGDVAGVDAKISTTRVMADRFTISSEDLGLTAEEARQYFLVHMMGNFSGRLPEAFVGSAGIFDLNLLFVDTGATRQAPAVTGDYVDLLRNQTVGGVVTSD